MTARWLIIPEELPGGPPNQARREKDHPPSHQQATRLHLRRYILTVPLSHQPGILTYTGDSRAYMALIVTLGKLARSAVAA